MSQKALEKQTVIAIVNNKSRVGKTTIAVNLGHALANRQKKALVVDLDSQCNSTSMLVDREFIQESLHDVLSNDSADVARAIYSTPYDGLKCLANEEETSALEFNLSANLPENYKILRTRIREYCKKKFDYTLIDCPPNLGFFVINALVASDFVIVPVKCGSRFSLEGLSKAISLIHYIQKTNPDNPSKITNPDLRFLRLAINNVDKRTTMAKVIAERLYANFGKEQIFNTRIGASTAFELAEEFNKTIIRQAPRSISARAYRELSLELCNILGDTGGRPKNGAKAADNQELQRDS